MAPEEFNDAALVEEFLVEADEYLRALDGDLLALERGRGTGEDDRELIENMFRATHTIKGLAAMFDFDDVKDLSHAMESVFQELRKKERSVDDACLNLMFAGVDALRDALAAVAGGVGDSPSARDVADQITQMLTRAAPAAVPLTDTSEDGAAESVRERVAAASDEGLRAVRLRMRWGIELRLGSLRVASFERALGGGEVLAICPVLSELPAPEAIDPERSDVTFEIIALTDRTDSEIADALGVSATAIGELSVLRESAQSGARDADVTLSASAQHVVRVDTARLDDLMDLTGEIVTARTRLEELVGRVRSAHPADEGARQLALATKDLARLVNGLQDKVMSLRMVPVGQLFSKFPRTVRDLARRSGKEIVLAFEGEDTELDKRLVERIEDALLHMVRNACDHGIEGVDERVALGKPRHGTVTLAARHEGGHVVIEVRDDGRGLDVGAIWSTAIDRGVIGPDQEFDEAVVVDIISQSGFSTAREITDVSGRGVGLDVVREGLLRLGGSIQYTTEFRAGTTFIMRVPLTLAIISALLVREADRTFAVPLVSVDEVFRVARGAVRSLGGSSFVDLRGESLPVADLACLLGFDATSEQSSSRPVVVVSSRGRRLGIAVGALLGQQQVVVKSLEAALGDVPGISGATIVGDGSVVPIVDIDDVVGIVSGRVSGEAVAGGVTR